MLDPEQMTGAQWFWICFFFVLFIFYICVWIDTHYVW
jgi:hypothetical protein